METFCLATDRRSALSERKSLPNLVRCFQFWKRNQNFWKSLPSAEICKCQRSPRVTWVDQVYWNTVDVFFSYAGSERIHAGFHEQLNSTSEAHNLSHWVLREMDRGWSMTDVFSRAGNLAFKFGTHQSSFLSLQIYSMQCTPEMEYGVPVYESMGVLYILCNRSTFEYNCTVQYSSTRFPRLKLLCFSELFLADDVVNH